MLLRAIFFVLAVPVFPQTVTYSTYLRDHFVPASIATDGAGNVYLAGYSTVDPLTQQLAPVVMKLDPSGQRFIYSRILGGSSGDTAAGIAVDQAGDAFIVGSAVSPDFPVTPGRSAGSLPANTSDPRTFLIKLDPQGNVLFSETIGTVSNAGQAVALAPAGQILVSGMSDTKGFAATSGAYSVPDTTGQPYLMELSADGSQVVFAATGIGGNALAFDSSGNIFMAGSTMLAGYPTTPGAYQTTFKPVFVCYGLCQIGFPGANQYVTKVDPAATKLLYSTGVAGNGSTTNSGIAVDAAGNAYVTGIVQGGTYPFTVAPGAGVVSLQPFVTKIDPAGANAIYSIPIGGAGVALSGNDVLVGGSYQSVFYGIAAGLPIAGPPPGVANLNPACQVNNLTTGSQAYVTQLDAATGNILNTVLVDATDSQARGIAFASGSAIWVAGTSLQADVPITLNALTPTGLTAGLLPGATLAKIDFSATSATGAPHLGCVLDAANMLRLGPVAPNQLVTLMGANLASSTITFDGQPATVLYSSASQINTVIPYAVGGKNFTTMQISSASGAVVTRQLPVILSEPSFFATVTSGVNCTPLASEFLNGFPSVASNQDGSLNACNNPAHAGSIVSFFLNGLGGEPTGNGGTVPLLSAEIPIAVSIGEWSAEVASVTAANAWVWRVDVLVPPVKSGEDAIVSATLNAPGGPISVGPLSPALPVGSVANPGTPLPISVWIAP
jgi:uncharacterized protein (TIGR03437 family)